MLTTFFNIYLTHSAQATPDLGLNRKFYIRRANDHFFSPDDSAYPIHAMVTSHSGPKSGRC